MPSKGTFVCFVLGLLLCIGIWVAVPYNNFAFNGSWISDAYLPEIVLFFLLILVVIVNPVLRRFFPNHVLSHRHLALIGGMMLFAAVVPSNGLMRFFPHCVAYDTQEINKSPEVATAIRSSGLPASLFPDEIGPKIPTPVSDQLIAELDPGETIPWSAWVAPFLSWGVLIVGFWVMMIGLGSVVYPQWRNSERLSFPLLNIYHAMIDDPEEGKALPPLFRSRLFWAGCGVVLVLHSFNGLALVTRGAFPAFPLSWDLSGALTEGVWRNASGFMRSSRLYFMFIGLAYFMPNRYSFSIWFTILLSGLFLMMSVQYMPWFDSGSLYDQGCGALIAIAVGILWLGRQHYWRVLRLVFRRSGSEEDKTDALGGRMFLAGCAIMLAWFIWAGAGVSWSAFFVITGVTIMLIVARVVAETGMIYIWIIPLTASRLIGLLPQKWTTVVTAFLQEAHYVLANRASAVCVAVMMILTLGLNRYATPKSGRQMAGIAIVVLVLGLLVCGAVHLNMGYHLASSYDGMVTPITGRGATQMSIGPVSDMVMGRVVEPRDNQLAFMVFGCALAGLLLFLCARFPAWPLHPIGLIFVNSSIGQRLFMSLLLGWLVKKLVLRYGGARVYRAAMPLFVGLILGEVFANVLWTLVPVVQILFGVPPADVRHMTIFQYS